MSPEELYPRHLTDQSRRVLDRLNEVVPNAVLIGGWATWLRAGAEMSHDIDMIVTHAERDIVASIAGGTLSSSTHVGERKWRAEVDEIHVDLYIPYESRLGNRLKLRVEDLTDETERISGWVVLSLEGHITTKMAALLDRPETQPGQKDRRELFDLLGSADQKEVGRRLYDVSELGADALVESVNVAYDLLSDALTKAQRRQTKRWPDLMALGIRSQQDISEGGVVIPSAPTARPRSVRRGTRRCGVVCADGHPCRQTLGPGATCPHHPPIVGSANHAGGGFQPRFQPFPANTSLPPIMFIMSSY